MLAVMVGSGFKSHHSPKKPYFWADESSVVRTNQKERQYEKPMQSCVGFM